jgi:hypothetical protein
MAVLLIEISLTAISIHSSVTCVASTSNFASRSTLFCMVVLVNLVAFLIK